MIGKVQLAGGPKCPICGKEFSAEPPLTPNIEDREFYGGRVKFFKDVDCDCTAKYKLCISKSFNPMKGEEEFQVINMIVEKVGVPLEQLRKEEDEKRQADAETKAIEAVHQAIEEKGEVPSLKQRQEIKRQTILATVVDKDAKIETLTHLTTHELQVMCKKRKIKFAVRDSKVQLAEKLLADDPSVVVANPND